MTKEPPFKKLREWIKVIQSSIVFVKVLEITCVVVIGIATNKLGSPAWAGILFVSALLYACISVIQILYQLKFPSDITNELEAHFELQKVNKQLTRKNEIFQYLAESIEYLNDQTCVMGGQAATDHLCDHDLKENIAQAISPLFEKTNYIFESGKTNFSIGLYLDNFVTLPQHIEGMLDIGNLRDCGILLLQDDHEIANEINKDLLTEVRVTGFRQTVRHCIEGSYHNDQYRYNIVERDAQNLSVFTTPIPEVCKNVPPKGVLFVITDEINEPEDIPQVLKIFTQIVSNLLSKQEECVSSRIQRINSEHLMRRRGAVADPEEVINLQRELNSQNESR